MLSNLKRLIYSSQTQMSALLKPITNTDLADFWQLLDAWVPAYVESFYASSSRRQGSQNSAFLGQGLEYMESTNYERGDEIRHLDWRLMAKTSEPYSKRFEALRQPQWCVVIDQRASMWFGTQNQIKLAQAIKMAAIISKQVSQMGAALSVWTINDEGLRRLPIIRTLNCAQSIVEQLNRQLTPSELEELRLKESNLSLQMVMSELAQNLNPNTQVVLLSDFADLEAQSQQDPQLSTTMMWLADKFHLMAIQIYDLAEKQLPRTSGVRLSAHNTRSLSLDKETSRARYNAWADAHFDFVHKWLLAQAIPHLIMNTELSFEQSTALWQDFCGRGFFNE